MGLNKLGRLTSLTLVLACVLLAPRRARADCSGPAACCVTDPALATAPLPERVRVGIRIMTLSAINEHDGSYGGELTVLFRWPAGGLRPDPTPRNASAATVAIDETRLDNGVCYREKRLTGSFQTWFRLRRFPFDRQLLRLNLEERQFTEGQVIYETALWPDTISIDAFRELSAWRIDDFPRMHIWHSSFAFPLTSPHPRLLIIETPVARLWQFYLTRYFLPLFLIVGLAYALFWIKPEDLGSASSIGITCMLAIIAFQLTQADTLPRVSYLTLADRVYIVCYLATAFALGAAVHESHLASSGRVERALALDRRYRRVFPLVFIVAVAAAATWGWYSQGDPLRDIPNVLPPMHAPPGER